MPTYEDASSVVAAAAPDPFSLTPYAGSTTDLGYLRQWTLEQVTAIYGVSADHFDTPTVFSTTILRDFVHRALYQIESSVPTIDELGSAFLGWNDVALAFRYPAQGLCALMSLQMWNVFQAFGYDTRRIDTISGDVGTLISADPANGTYSHSHVTTEVFVNDLNKWIVQDPTFDFLFTDGMGNILSWYETRSQNYGSGDVNFVGFHDYLSWQFTHEYEEEISVANQNHFKDNYLNLPWSWQDSNGRSSLVTLLFPDYQTAHVVGSNQGGTFETEDAALAALTVEGDWLDVAQSLRGSGYYISGFMLVDGEDVSRWLTARLADGSYFSVNLETGDALVGSYDQLVNDATGGPGDTPRAELNPGVDLSIFLSPASLLAYDGGLMEGGIPLIRNIIEGDSSGNALIGLPAADGIYGLAGNDTINGAAGSDLLHGDAGSDILIGGAGADALFGGSGVDVASYETATAGVTARLDYSYLNTGDAAGDTYSEVEGLRGSSYADTLCGDAAANTLAGWAGDDSLWGSGGGDTLDGGDGNDYLVGAAGADTFIGGAGSDTVSYYFAAAGLTARLDHPRLSTGEALGDSYSGIENLYGSKFADTLCGNAGANALTGWEGNDSLWGYGGGDTLDGGDGNDYLVGAAGADAFIGGAGSDTVSYYFATAGLTARLDHPNLNTGEALGDSYSGIENILGSKFADTLCGNAGANVLTGREGNDSLWGYGGGDAFDGGEGNDYLVGAAGADTFIGGAGSDTVSYYFAAAGLTARLDHPRLSTGEALGDSYSGIENLYGSKFIDTLCGNAGANVLTGREGNDSLWGYGGGDTLDGGDGNDYLVGAAGADAFIGGAGSDTVSYNFATSGVVANLAAPAGNTGEALGDSYSGIENILGSAYNDTLTGNSGSNFLQGGKGNDTLIGGADGDALSGGEGNDTFVFRLGEVSGDVITDFLGNGANPGDQLTFEGFGAGATFTSIDATHWQVNYNGGTAHEIITFSNPVSIHSTDVIFA